MRSTVKFRVRPHLLAAVATTVLASGCGLFRLPEPERFEGPLPTADAVLAALGARRHDLRSLRSLAKLTYRSPRETQSARHVIVVERPDRLRFEVLSILGAMFVLTTSDGSMAVYLPREATLYRGSASRRNLARYTFVDLSIANAVDLMLGTPLLTAPAEVSRDDGLLRVAEQGGDQTQTAWFANGLDLVRWETRDRDGKIQLRASFADYTEIDGRRLARRVRVEFAGGDEQIEIALRDPEVNPRLADTLFIQETPEGGREVLLEEVL